MLGDQGGEVASVWQQLGSGRGSWSGARGEGKAWLGRHGRRGGGEGRREADVRDLLAEREKRERERMADGVRSSEREKRGRGAVGWAVAGKVSQKGKFSFLFLNLCFSAFLFCNFNSN